MFITKLQIIGVSKERPEVISSLNLARVTGQHNYMSLAENVFPLILSSDSESQFWKNPNQLLELMSITLKIFVLLT